MTTMKAVRIHRFGGPEVMEMEDVPIPEPGEGEVLVRTRGASVNPVDYKTRQGQFPPIDEGKLPITLGRDVSGIVERCGPGVRQLSPGDEVYALLGPDRGAFAEFVVLTESEAAKKPTSLSHPEAAAVPLAALTAWQGLFDHGRLAAGQRVLIHGGAGGVGHLAVQFAKQRGATVLTTVSGADIEFARGLAADEVIDYKAERFEDVAGEIDVVFDLVAGETQQRSWSVLKPHGILVSTLGQPSQPEVEARAGRNQLAAGYLAQGSAEQLAEIARLIDAGKVRPIVEATYPFAAAAEAERRHEEGHVRGKIVLDLAA